MKEYLIFLTILLWLTIGAHAQKIMPGNGEWERWGMTPEGKEAIYEVDIMYKKITSANEKLLLGEEGSSSTSCRIIYGKDGNVYLKGGLGDIWKSYLSPVWMKSSKNEDIQTVNFRGGTSYKAIQDIRMYLRPIQMYLFDCSNPTNVQLEEDAPIVMQLNDDGTISDWIAPAGKGLGLCQVTSTWKEDKVEYSNYIVTELHFTLSSYCDNPTPPDNLAIEQWQMICYNHYACINPKGKTVGFSLDMVRDGDNVYLRGFGDSHYQVHQDWVKGKFEDNQLILFSHDNENRENFIPATPFEWNEKETGYYVKTIYFSYTQDDMRFVYNSDTEEYMGGDIGFSIAYTNSEPPAQTTFECREGFWNNIFLRPIISRPTTTFQEPTPPGVTLQSYDLSFGGNLKDINDDIIPINQLAFRVFLDNQPVELWKDTEDIWRDTHYIPFITLESDYVDNFGYYSTYIDDEIVKELYEKATPNSELRVEKVNFTNEGPIVASKTIPFPGNNSGIKTIEDDWSDSRMFDLNGREVHPDKLSPGIYIQNHKKIIVK